MAPAPSTASTRAHQAARELGQAPGSRRQAATARFVEVLEPEKRPEGLPEPGSLETLADPVGTLASPPSVGPGLVQARARLPLGLLALDPAWSELDLATVVSLAVASGNGLLLVGPLGEGGEAVAAAGRQALADAGFPKEAIVHRAGSPGDSLPGQVDAILGPSLTGSSDPTGGDPVVHTYVDGAADVDAALSRALEAARGAGAHATDTILVHEALATAILEDLVAGLQAGGLSVEAGEAARRRAPRAGQATRETWQGREGVCGVRVVGSLDEALDHVRVEGGSVEAILTRESEAARRFVRGAGADAVLVDAPTSEADRLELPSPRPRRLGDPPARPADLTETRSILVGSPREGSQAEPPTLEALLRDQLGSDDPGG